MYREALKKKFPKHDKEENVAHNQEGQKKSENSKLLRNDEIRH